MATRDIYETGFDEDVRVGSSANQCPECDGRVTTNAVEAICEDCGLVIDEQRIDHGPEWRAYDKEECERTGAPLTAARHDRGLSTEIGRGTDAKGNELSGKKRRRLARMRREQTRGRWRSKAERNLTHGLGEVRRLASALELSNSVRDQACQLFRSAQSEDLLRGRSIEAIAAVSVYGACRCNGLSRLVDDVSEVTPSDNASRRPRVATLTSRRPPTASAGPVGRQSQTGRRNAGSVSPTISRVTPPARLSQRRRRISVSSTWSSSRPRSTGPSQRAVPGRTSSLPTRRSRPSTTTRSSTISTRRRRASWPSNGPHSPTRYRCRQRRESGFSVPPVTGLGGTGRKRRSVRSRPRRGSTTSVGTASATRRVSTRSSTTPTTRCGWFQR